MIKLPFNSATWGSSAEQPSQSTTSEKSFCSSGELAFLQVEMFGVTADETGGESAQLLDQFVSLQKELFSALELHYRSVHNRRGNY